MSDVLIVGAGPTGLALGSALLGKGLDVTVVDRLEAGQNTSRAAVVHARTLELLERIEVADRLVELGAKAPLFTIRDRDRVLVPIDFGGLPTAYPYSLMISQATTEQVLLDRFTALGGKVERPCEVVGVEQDGSGATVVFADGERRAARYVVGADGMHSTVRDHAGIAFEGDDVAESFLLADITTDGGLPADEVILYFSRAGMVVAAPLPDGSTRIVAVVDEAPEHPDAAFVQNLLDTRGPAKANVRVREVVWGSRFRIHHRVAGSYRNGRVLLIGDAAHVHSPAGGQGMNLGLHDAILLGDVLASVLGGASDEPLDTYAADRRKIARQVIALASRLTRLATVSPARRGVRNLALSTLAKLPPLRRTLAMRLSGLVYR